MKLSIIAFFKSLNNKDLILWEDTYKYHLTLSTHNAPFAQKEINHLHDRANKNLKHINVEKRNRGI